MICSNIFLYLITRLHPIAFVLAVPSNIVPINPASIIISLHINQIQFSHIYILSIYWNEVLPYFF
ncbi:hypothetical protein CW304_00355 [Bacillus sp. UFRGS-B20]|nr:hypothetical protein CW304_00355 [Bacillus sp. UFRGS-B20]